MISSILDIRIYSAMTVFKSTCISIQVIHLKALDSISWKWKVEQASLTGRACCQSLEVCKSLSRSIHYFLCHILDLLLLSVHCPNNIVAQEAGVQEGLQYSENKSFTSRRAHTRSPPGPQNKWVQLISLFASPSSKLNMEWKWGQQWGNLGILTSLACKLESGNYFGNLKNGNGLEDSDKDLVLRKRSFTLLLKENKSTNIQKKAMVALLWAEWHLCLPVPCDQIHSPHRVIVSAAGQQYSMHKR